MVITLDTKILKDSERLASLAEKLDPNPKIEGFHLTWISRNSEGTNLEIAQAPIGNVRSPWGGPAGIRGYSNEKALRAAAHALRDPTAISSWQTRSVERGMYQGAVIFPGVWQEFNVLSVSAYEEPIDEAIALIIGQEMGFGDMDFARRVIEVSGNKSYIPLQDMFYKS